MGLCYYMQDLKRGRTKMQNQSYVIKYIEKNFLIGDYVIQLKNLKKLKH